MAEAPVFAPVTSYLAAGGSESPLSESRRRRAARALGRIGAPETTIEIRPNAHDSDRGSFWLRGALGFVALATVMAAAPQAQAKAGREPRQSPAMTALAAQVAQQWPAGAAGSALPRVPILPSVMVRIEGRDVPTLNPLERVRLCQVVATRENLQSVGRDWRDIYAVVQAETGWAAREGKGRNGKSSFGLAQLESATAKALGIDDPNDPMQALSATARLVKESVLWARARGIEMKDAAISVHYNLSTSARNAWDGKSVESLPYETQRHVANFLQGRRDAEFFGRQRVMFDRALSRDLEGRRPAQELLAKMEQVSAQPAIQVMAARVGASAAGAPASSSSQGSGSVASSLVRRMERWLSKESARLADSSEASVRVARADRMGSVHGE